MWGIFYLLKRHFEFWLRSLCVRCGSGSQALGPHNFHYYLLFLFFKCSPALSTPANVRTFFSLFFSASAGSHQFFLLCFWYLYFRRTLIALCCRFHVPPLWARPLCPCAVLQPDSKVLTHGYFSKPLTCCVQLPYRKYVSLKKLHYCYKIHCFLWHFHLFPPHLSSM